MTRHIADGFAILTAAGDVESGKVGSGDVLDDSCRTPVLTFSDVHLDHLSADDKEQEELEQTTARSEWVPHIDFQPTHNLLEPLNEQITSDIEQARDCSG